MRRVNVIVVLLVYHDGRGGGGGDARSPYGQAVVLLWVAVDLAMLAIIMLCVGKPT